MFRTLTVVAVRQDGGQTAETAPFGFAGRQELVDGHLRAVGKVAELRFPNGQFVGRGAGKTVFERHDRFFIQDGVNDEEFACAFAHIAQRYISAVIPFFAFLVVQYGMTV